MGTCLAGWVLESSLPAGLVTLPVSTTNEISFYSVSAALSVANADATGKIYALKADGTSKYTTTG